MDPVIIIVIVFIGLISAGAIAWSVSLIKKRRVAWVQQAEALSLSYRRHEPEFVQQYKHMRFFKKAWGVQRVANALHGRFGDREVHILDYQLVEMAGKRNKSPLPTVCLVEDIRLSAPHCWLRFVLPGADAIGRLLGGQDINFDEDEPFSRMFVVQGENETETRAFFDPDLRQLLMQRADNQIYFEVNGATLMFGRFRLRPEQVSELVTQTLQLLDHLIDSRSPKPEARRSYC